MDVNLYTGINLSLIPNADSLIKVKKKMTI